MQEYDLEFEGENPKYVNTVFLLKNGKLKEIPDELKNFSFVKFLTYKQEMQFLNLIEEDFFTKDLSLSLMRINHKVINFLPKKMLSNESLMLELISDNADNYIHCDKALTENDDFIIKAMNANSAIVFKNTVKDFLNLSKDGSGLRKFMIENQSLNKYLALNIRVGLTKEEAKIFNKILLEYPDQEYALSWSNLNKKQAIKCLPNTTEKWIELQSNLKKDIDVLSVILENITEKDWIEETKRKMFSEVSLYLGIALVHEDLSKFINSYTGEWREPMWRACRKNKEFLEICNELKIGEHDVKDNFRSHILMILMNKNLSQENENKIVKSSKLKKI